MSVIDGLRHSVAQLQQEVAELREDVERLNRVIAVADEPTRKSGGTSGSTTSGGTSSGTRATKSTS